MTPDPILLLIGAMTITCPNGVSVRVHQDGTALLDGIEPIVVEGSAVQQHVALHDGTNWIDINYLGPTVDPDVTYAVQARGGWASGACTVTRSRRP
jgi:hypothetical protein